MDSIEVVIKMIEEATTDVKEAKERLIRRLKLTDDYSMTSIAENEWTDFQMCLNQKILLEGIRDRMLND